jgi:GTP-binding protein
MGFTVAIVGRTNVGKSTFFNRLTGQRKAIIDDTSGVTRDRLYDEVDWQGRQFNIVDTGGLVPHSEDVFEKGVRDQVQLALDEADLIIFMVDVTTGITDLDSQIADMLRKKEHNVLLVVNKVDNFERQTEAAEFYSLGFSQLFNVSSMSGSGTGDLLDEIVNRMGEHKDTEDVDIPRIAIVGQPNVGKSSLINTLIGEERNLVTEVAGTTRDAVHARYNLYNKDFYLIDTAGLRKKRKVHEDIEYYSVIRAVKAIDEADVSILMIDATLGLEAQDLSIFSLAQSKKKGIVIAVNKWDVIEKDAYTWKDYRDDIYERIAPFTDVPVMFISATQKQRVYQLVEKAIEVYQNRKRRISTSDLNNVLQKAFEMRQPPAVKGKSIHIKYANQLPSKTPSFALYCNYPHLVKKPYKNYIENQLRKQFNFTGVPISLVFKEK